MKQDFKKIYTDWLYENIEEYKVNDSVYCLTLPFLDHNNDCIEIFIKILENGKYRITDDAETIDELRFSQFDVFASPRRKEILDSVLKAHGVSLSNNDELYIDCSKNNLAVSKHMLSQCIMKVSDMFYLSKKNAKSLFFEDVRTYFDN